MLYVELSAKDHRLRDDKAFLKRVKLTPEATCSHFMHPSGYSVPAHIEPFHPDEEATCASINIDFCVYQNVKVVNAEFAAILKRYAGETLVTGPCYVKGQVIPELVTINCSIRVWIRGDAGARLNFCDRCGGALYSRGFSRNFLLEQDVKGGFAVAMDASFPTLMVSRDVLSDLKNHMQNVGTKKLQVVDKPQDGFPAELSQLPPYFKDKKLMEKLNRERKPGLPAKLPDFVRRRIVRRNRNKG